MTSREQCDSGVSGCPFIEQPKPPAIVPPPIPLPIVVPHLLPNTTASTLTSTVTASSWAHSSTSSLALSSSLLPSSTTSRSWPTPHHSESATATSAIHEGGKGSVRVSVLSTLTSESAARATVASAATASIATAVIASPSAAVAATRIGFVLSSVECQYGAGDAGPDLLQYPVSVGDGLEAYTVGVASSFALTLLVVVFGRVFAKGRGKLSWIVQRVEAAFHQYYAPSMASGAVLVVRHASSPILVACVSVCALCEAGVLLWHCYVVAVLVPREVQCERGPEGMRGTVKTRWVGALVEQHGAFFEMCRSKAAAVRMCFFVELCGSAVMGCIAGWQPTTGSCTPLAVSMLAVAVVLFAYELLYRPYQCIRDNVCGAFFGAMQVAQALCAVALSSGWLKSMDLLASITLCLSWSLVLQLCVAVAWAAVLHARRQAQSLPSGASAASGGVLDVPMQDNPLDAGTTCNVALVAP